MVTMNVSLPDPMKSWVEQQSQSGRYANSSDYVRDLIRRDQQRAGAIAEMQSEIDAGLASGAAEPFDTGAFKGLMRRARGG
ncbi:MAG: type II toxin-antitoxin system ParD family antitoxin [Paracoccaceae bacterium]